MVARTLLLLGFAIAIAAPVVGCGGGSDDAGDASAADPSLPTKEEFVKQASAACKKERVGEGERISTYLAQHRSESRAERYEGLAHFVLLPTIEAQLFRLEELSPPAGEAERIDAMLDAEVFATDRVATAKRIVSKAAVYREFAEVSKQFQAYGLPACANAPKHQ